MLLTSGNYCETPSSLAVAGRGVGIYLIELRFSIRGLSRTGRLFAWRHHQTLQQQKGALVLIWIGNPSLSSHWPQSCRCSAHCGARGTPCGGVWYDGPLIWVYCSYLHKSLILPETLSFKCIFWNVFSFGFAWNNCACCHKIKNTYGNKNCATLHCQQSISS